MTQKEKLIPPNGLDKIILDKQKMIFKGVDNQSVEFRITKYEFPNITDCEYDSNWLLIYLNVKSKSGNWKTSNPSLLTSDVKRIIKWFNDLSMGKSTEKNLSFLEPNLEFDLIKNKTELKTPHKNCYM